MKSAIVWAKETVKAQMGEEKVLAFKAKMLADVTDTFATCTVSAARAVAGTEFAPSVAPRRLPEESTIGV